MVCSLHAVLASTLARADSADNGCDTGAVAIANAYILVNPMYELAHSESLENYVRNNAEHFVRNGDAIRCARAMAAALIHTAVENYDHEAIRRQQELNAKLGASGVTRSGSEVQSIAAQFYFMGQQIALLAEVLPEAAEGGPLRTYLNPEQQAATQFLSGFLQDPSYRDLFISMQPMLLEMAKIEFDILVSIANGLDTNGPGDRPNAPTNLGLEK